MKKSLVENSIFNLLRNFITLAFPVMIFMYASRILGAEGIGRVEFCKNFSTYFALMASLGINNYGIREGARKRNSREDFSKFVHEVLIINLISTAFSLLLYLGVISFIPKLVEYRSIFLIFISTIVMTPMGVEWVYGAQEEYKYIALRTMAFQIIAFLLMFVLVKDESSLIGYAIVLIVSSVGSNIANLVCIRKFVSFKLFKNYNIKQHIKPIIVLFALAISNTLYSYVDTTMIGFLSGDVQVGLYSVALKVNRIVVNVLGAIGAVVMPRLSFEWANGNKQEFLRITKIVINVLLMFSFPCMAGLIGLSKPLIILFCGDGFIEAQLMMQILSLIVVILSVSTFFNMHILLPMNKEKYTLITIFSGLCFNVATNAFLIPRLGGVGAAIGTIIGETVVLVLGMKFVKEYVNLRDILKNCYQYIIGFVVVLACCLVCVHFINNNILVCITSVVTSVIAYGVLLIAMKNHYIMIFWKKFVRKFKKGEV